MADDPASAAPNAATPPRSRLLILRVPAVFFTVAIAVPTLYFTLAPKARPPPPSFSPGPAEPHPIDTLVRANTPARPIATDGGKSSSSADPAPPSASATSVDSIPPAIDTLWQRLQMAESSNSNKQGGTQAETATPSPSPSLLSQWANSMLSAQSSGVGEEGICYPRSAEELVKAVTVLPCPVVILNAPPPTTDTKPPSADITLDVSSLLNAEARRYMLKDVMNVTMAKLVLGDPLAMPIIDGRHVRRCFDVMDGGRLDLRQVVLVRGSPAKPTPEQRIVTGGNVRVNLGGAFTASGVIFREDEQTLEAYEKELREAGTQRHRLLGNHVLVTGGNLFLYGCVFYGARPFGHPIVNHFRLGSDILILAGNGIAVGVYHVTMNLYGANVVIGQVICVLGGTYTWVGGGLANVVGVQAQAAAGSVIFVGGGVCVIVGITYGTATGVGFRANYGQFSVGGGVLFQLGFATASTWGVGARFWAGANYALGAGIMRCIGGASASATTAESGMGSGGGFFVGSGNMHNQGFARLTTRTSLYNAGNGFGSWNGQGMYLNRHNPSLGVDIARAQYGIASDVAQGSGFGLYFNNTRYNYQLVRNWFGLGNTIWLGSGIGIISRLVLVSIRFRNFAIVGDSVTIDGVRLNRAEAQKGKGYVIKDGVAYPIQRARRGLQLQLQGGELQAEDTLLTRLPDYPALLEEQAKKQKHKAMVGTQEEGVEAHSGGVVVKTVPMDLTMNPLDKIKRRRKLQDGGSSGMSPTTPARGTSLDLSRTRLHGIFADNYIDERTEDLPSLARRIQSMRRLEEEATGNEGSNRQMLLLERPGARLFDPYRRIQDFQKMFQSEGLAEDATEDDAGARRQLSGSDKKPWTFAAKGEGTVLACNQRPGLTATHFASTPSSLDPNATQEAYNGSVTTYADGSIVHQRGNGSVVLMEQCPPSLLGRILPSAEHRVLPSTSTSTSTGDENGPSQQPESESEALPDSHLLWYKLEVTCLPPTKVLDDQEASLALADCVNATSLKDALLQYLPESSTELTVASTALPAAAQSASTPQLDLSLTPVDHPSCPPSPLAPLAFNLYLAHSSEDDTEKAAVLLDALVKDASPLLALLPPPVEPDRSSAVTPHVCAASLTRVVRTVFPPAERMPAFSPRTLGLFGPAVMLSDGDEPAPPRRVSVGRTYHLQALNFPTGAKLQVRVLAKAGLGRRMVGEPLLLPVVDKEGRSNMTWTPPAALLEDDKEGSGKGVRFVLLVKPLQGGVLPFAYSNALKAVHAY